MAKNSAHKTLVLDFLKAFETGDLDAIDKMLAPNFRDIRPNHAEWPRHEFMRAMEVLFAARKSCSIDLRTLITEGKSVAAEVTMRMEFDGESAVLAQHNLYLIDDNKIAELRVYGDGAD